MVFSPNEWPERPRHVSRHSAGSRGRGHMSLASSAARSARRVAFALAPRCASAGPTARDALFLERASSSSHAWSTTRGVATRVVSCGNGDFGRLGHGGDGRGRAGLGMSAETFQRMTGIPQVATATRPILPSPPSTTSSSLTTLPSPRAIRRAWTSYRHPRAGRTPPSSPQTVPCTRAG